jgi:polyphenol oxidase
MIQFPPLEDLSWLAHGFTSRQADVDVTGSRSEMLKKLHHRHEAILQTQGIEWEKIRFAEQVHGNHVAIVGRDAAPVDFPKADGLVTISPGMGLGIYVADCCAVFLVETQRRAIGLLHSGKKGTELNIASAGLQELLAASGGSVDHVLAVLSPCIHDCCYDINFVEEIEKQLRSKGVDKVFRHSDCTGCLSEKYYSYRREKGQTGRMLAFMMVK